MWKGPPNSFRSPPDALHADECMARARAHAHLLADHEGVVVADAPDGEARAFAHLSAINWLAVHGETEGALRPITLRVHLAPQQVASAEAALHSFRPLERIAVDRAVRVHAHAARLEANPLLEVRGGRHHPKRSVDAAGLDAYEADATDPSAPAHRGASTPRSTRRCRGPSSASPPSRPRRAAPCTFDRSAATEASYPA